MGPAQAIKTGFAKSFQFSGRASRPEFWWFAAFVWAITGIALSAAISYVSYLDTNCGCRGWGDEPKQIVLIPLVLLLLVATIPALARRLRDAGLFAQHLWVVATIFMAEILIAIYETFLPGSGPVGSNWPPALVLVRNALDLAAIAAFGVSYLLALFPTEPNQDAGRAPPSEVTP